jgi:hypothetical protein
MENTINLRCLDIKLLLDDGKNISVEFICYDNNNKIMVNIVAPIHEQITKTYGKDKISKDFVKMLVYKLKYTIRVEPKELTFLNDNGSWCLKTLLQDIYNPITITRDGLKIVDKIYTLDTRVLRIFCHNKKYFLECFISKLDTQFNYLVYAVKEINIDEKINSIYDSKKIRDRFIDKLKITKIGKRSFVKALSLYLTNKIINIDNDEHEGYKLWTDLEDLVYINDNNFDD